MFAQIYNTAKRILSRSPSVQGRSSEARDTTPISTTHSLEVTMVTTRRGTETPGQDTPRSSSKGKIGKRELDILDTPTAVKRQKKSAPKQEKVEVVPEPAPVEDEAVHDSTEDTSDTIAVAVPTQESFAMEELLPIRRRSSPRVMVAKPSPPVSTETEDGDENQAEDAPTPTQETVYQTPDQRSESMYATPATRKRGDASPTPRSKRASERTSAKTSASKKNTRIDVEETSIEATPTKPELRDEIPSSTFDSEQAPIASQDAPATPSQPKQAHMRFGSEEPADTQQDRFQAPPSAQKQTEPEEDLEDEDASDSDEAPEVVTTTVAASKAKASQQDAARALLAQEEKERQKREAREKRIAEEQAEKRQRDEKKAKKLAKLLAKQKAAEQSTDDDAPQSRITIDPTNLPDLLPPDLLSNLPDQRAPTPPPEASGKTEEQLQKEKLNRHIKFLERTDKGPKDIKKGKLSVAVLAQQNKVLPPTVSRETKNVREKWLQGRKVESKKSKFLKSKVERRGFANRGFLRGDD
ncbi:U3 snoRNA associated-domain-containing protein [Paraphoma chrysanthemicola]|nr:U3 snoRNA associated-domain-containing protein [Paraphoma chrysanthemicola]